MKSPSDSIVLRLPRSAIGVLPSLSTDLLGRMHSLLERNTDGDLNEMERSELDTLVQMAQFAQLLAIASEAATTS